MFCRQRPRKLRAVKVKAPKGIPLNEDLQSSAATLEMNSEEKKEVLAALKVEVARITKSETNAERLQRLKVLVSDFPTEPGVYLMKNQTGKIIYVGKAKSLRNRVRSYLNESQDHTPKTKFLVAQIHSIELLRTKTEVEAFLLEATLIKKNRPKFNIRLRDDKAYPYIKLSVFQEFPRFYLSRRVSRDGSLYFGPFMRGLDVFTTIRFLNKTFQVRDCTDNFMASRKRPCLTHEIGRCRAPCVGLVSAQDYGKDLEGAVLFLRGQGTQLVKKLTRQMTEAAGEERFESAASLRDSITSLKSVLDQQEVVEEGIEQDQDVIGYFTDPRGTVVEVLHIRRGRVISYRPHFFADVDLSKEDLREWLIGFINQYYDDNVMPDELLTGVELGNDLRKLLEAVLKERSHKAVRVRFPTDQNGTKLLEMTERYARDHFKEELEKKDKKIKGLEEIQKRLSLPSLPHRIECFDISHFQGEETVASQVVFEDGLIASDHYRRYKIRTVVGSNDFASMKEVLRRRFLHTEYELPGLVVIDGGKGQLAMAVEALAELQIKNVPVVGLAKARTQGDFTESDVHSTEERFFLPGRMNPITFAKSSEAHRILTGIRDEAHRFAITYHRKLRGKAGLGSQLDVVPGLGESKKKALLKAFGSVDEIRKTPAAELAKLRGMNRVLAERILLALNEDSQARPIESEDQVEAQEE